MNSIFRFSLSLMALTLLCIIISCSKTTNNNKSPEIKLLGINKDKLNQGSLGINDTLIASISFVDTDGDLSGIVNNVVIIDNRNAEVHYTNTIPDLPTSKKGNIGQMQLVIPTLCCIFSDGTPACETPPNFPTNELTFDIYLIDAAGNESNRVTTPNVTLLCN